jgi:RNA polymerase primary sigma factor
MSTYEGVDHFLQKAARIPLLTTEEEIHLARSVQRMMALYQAKPGGPYTKAELGHIRRGTRAKERFISANLRLVANVASKYYRVTSTTIDLPHEDMIQEGMFGLMRAVEKFDPERGYKFSTYAYWWIRQSIIRGMQMGGRLVRLPAHIHEKLYSLRNRQHALALQLGRAPSMQELADNMEIPVDLLEHVLVVGSRPGSLNARIGENECALMDVVTDEVSSSDRLESLSTQLDVDRINGLINSLNERERSILTMRYGLDGSKPATLMAVGKRFGITREGARVVCAHAMRKIKQQMDAESQLAPQHRWRRIAC